MNELEKNMIRGLYIRKLKDFQEMIKETSGKKTLFQRLKEGEKP